MTVIQSIHHELCCGVLQWIETVEVTPIPQEGAEKPQEGALLPQGGDEEGKGKKGRERREENGSKHPSLEEVKLCCSKTGLPDSDAIWFWNKCEANGWTNGGNKIKSWPHTIASWKAAGYLPSQKKNPPKSDRPVGGNF